MPGRKRKTNGLLGRPAQEEELWKRMEELQDCDFFTAKGLKFRYHIRGGEMFVSRKSKSITQATVFMAFRRAQELGGEVSGPKKLGTFGASYLYPVFVRLGVVQAGPEAQEGDAGAPEEQEGEAGAPAGQNGVQGGAGAPAGQDGA